MQSESNAGESIQFYRVALACEAAADIGCGIQSKPVLSNLEAHGAVASAWLHRSGTILAVRWRAEPQDDEGVVASAFTTEQCACAERISDPEERRAFMRALQRDDGWYTSAGVDQLSTEEAAIIANRVVRRMTAHAALDSETRTRLIERIAHACNVVLTTEGPGTYDSRAERLAKAILDTGRSELSDSHYRPLRDAVTVGGVRALPNEE